MNLVVDIGNSFIKAAFFNEKKVMSGIKKFPHNAYQEMEEYFSSLNVTGAIVSDVTGNATHILEHLSLKKLPLLFIDGNTPVPVRVAYESRETLGTDRLAAVVGARSYFKGENVLVVNTGTCITYEFLDSDEVYQGGIIAPGMEMRMKAMHHFTGKLPLLTLEESPALIGRNTAACMLSGAVNGTVSEVEGIIKTMEDACDDLKVVICGGYTSYLASKLKREIFARPNLVLEGLNEILLYNFQR